VYYVYWSYIEPFRPSRVKLWDTAESWDWDWRPLHTHDTESPWLLHIKHSDWWKRRSRSKFALQLCLREQSMWMRDGCKVYIDSYMAPNGSCFMVTWIIIKYHHLEVDLTQNKATMALQNLTTIYSIYFILCEDPAWIEIHWNSIWMRIRSHMTSHYTWGFVTALHDFWWSWNGLWILSFGLSQFHSHGPWLLAPLWSGPEICTSIFGDEFACYSGCQKERKVNARGQPRQLRDPVYWSAAMRMTKGPRPYKWQAKL
jgi:hypothetical protein